jgi:hypothetical protein
MICAVLGVTSVIEAVPQSATTTSNTVETTPQSTEATVPSRESLLGKFLETVIKLDHDQFSDLARGKLVTKQLPTPEKGEIAAFGIVWVNGTTQALLHQARDVQRFRKFGHVTEMGRFGKRPQVEDLQGLTLADIDRDLLKDCVPGKCGVKLDAATIERLRTEVDWSAPDAAAKATQLVKKRLVAYVQAYLQGGTDAMGVIVDGKQPKALSAEFQVLLGNSPFLYEFLPEFSKYLQDYPKEKLSGAEDLFFWMKDTLGPKPVTSVQHATFRQSPGPGVRLLLSYKQIYASHFYNAGLEISAAVEAPDAGGKPGFYLLSLYRTRMDPPTGMLAGVVLGKVRGGIEQGVAERLQRAKDLVEGGR